MGELMKQIQKGKFTLAMMRDQFEDILKMGSFGQIMQMIPGLNNMPKESEQASQKELQSTDIGLIEKSPTRRMRICRGSGVHPNYIQELINVYRPFAAAAGKMKKLPFGKNGELPKNPAQMGKLANMMPASFLKQISGQSGFMNLMQKFQGAEQGMDMSNMQNMMKNMGNYQKMMK